MGHPIHKHMHTHITKSNVHAAIKDDKAHMDYLKRDIKDDARGRGDGNKEWETADEKHITHLAEDVKYDEKKEHVSRKSSSPLHGDGNKSAHVGTPPHYRDGLKPAEWAGHRVNNPDHKHSVSRKSSSPVNNLKGKDGELVPSTEGIYRKSSSPAKMNEIMWEGEGHNLTDIDIKKNR